MSHEEILKHILNSRLRTRPDTYPGVATAREIKLILAITDPTARRLRLRQMAAVSLNPYSILISKIMKASPLIGDGDKQIKSACTTAAFRDLLPYDVLLACAFSEAWVICALQAVLDPAENGTPGKTKTGYAFGRHKALTNEVIAEMKTQLDEIVAAGKPASHGGAPTPIEKEDKMAGSQITIVERLFVTAYDGGRAGVSHDKVIHAIRDALNEWRKKMGDGRPSVETTTIRKVVEDLHERRWSDFPALSDSEKDQTQYKWMQDFVAQALWDDGQDPVRAEAKEEVTALAELREPGEHEAKVIDVVLASQGLPPIREMVNAINASKARIASLEEEAATTRGMSLTMSAPVVIEAKGDIPKGEVTTMKAHEAMGLTRAKEAFDFDVPVWKWEHDHPHVPAKDEDYIFQPLVLLRALYALVTNQRSWIYGHTGTGKSTLVEQICARLNWPMARVNFDSEITRLDLVGREALREEGGVTVSHFVEGILPQAMQQPVVMCMDEMDYIRPDVSYVLQRVTEGNGLLLTEDGGRLVRPHPMFRIMATANTQGQGDEYGMYAGARQQSMAFLDRFTSWIEVEYLDIKQRKELIQKRVPNLSESLRDELASYSEEHIEAFKQGKVMQPLSPRGLIEAGRAIAAFTSIMPRSSRKKAIEEALGTVLLDRATPQDRAVLRGIADRVFK